LRRSKHTLKREFKKPKHFVQNEEVELVETPSLRQSFTAKNKEQKQAVRSIVENQVSFILGRAGCGKTILAAGILSEWLVKGKLDKIIISRPLEFTGRNLGALPGDIEEKTYCWFIHIKEYLIRFLGKATYDKFKMEGKIVYQPLEIIRGLNLERSALLIEECQNISWEQCKVALTRIGDDESRVILTGDPEQADIRDPCIEKLVDKLEPLEEVGLTYLEENFRHPIVEKIARIL
jgi:phosphate starvation-inducible PhoH-like protein